MAAVFVAPWSAGVRPTEQSLRLLMQEQGLSPYSWSNDPFETYAPHSHDYDKVIYVVSGSITFELPDDGRRVVLNVGGRLDLPVGAAHEAAVGGQGVVCLQAH
jgi:quercetin dioxygenase-like cupin family protein